MDKQNSGPKIYREAVGSGLTFCFRLERARKEALHNYLRDLGADSRGVVNEELWVA